MGINAIPTIIGSIGLSMLLSGSAIGADPYPPVPGSYRPTGEYPARTGRDNSQFAPATVNPAPAYQPITNPGTYYAPPAYGNSSSSTPGFSINPGNMINSMFGTGNNNLPWGYPQQPLTGSVAPVYDPPLPGAATPGWNNYGTQPTTPAYDMQPATPAYTQQPASTPPNAQGVAPVTPTDYGSMSTLAPKERLPATTQAAPRPFSNPQTSGNSFPQRPGGPNFGRNDSRFRPPELKGTP